MTREESLTIVSMVLSHWRAKDEWSKEEIDVYARLIQDMDAELTTHALVKAAKEIPYRPTVAELRERVRIERRRLAPEVRPREEGYSREVPLWVKRWICARMLYPRWGMEAADMRRFPEQGDYGDLSQPTMPEGAWEEQARSISDKDVAAALRAVL